MSFAKQKGTQFETAIVKYLQQCGFETPRRVALSGAAGDKGDIWLGTNPTKPTMVIECKNYAKDVLPYKLTEDFIKEAHTEYMNACGTDVVNNYRALLIIHRLNLGTADSWLVWKNHVNITVRARLGDVIDETTFADNSKLHLMEEEKIDYLVFRLSSKIFV